MIKFDFELMKAGRKVQLLSGQPVEILTYNRPGNYPIVGMLEDGEVVCFNKKGYGSQGHFQLCMKPQTQKRYINVYVKSDTGEMYLGEVCNTLEKSMDNAALSQRYSLTFVRREIVEITL